MTARVIAIFGNKAYTLPHLLNEKGSMLTELQAYTENAYAASERGKFFVRKYQRQSKPNRKLDEYYESSTSKASIEINLKEGWLKFTDIDLRDRAERREYLRALEKQLADLKAGRNEIARMLQGILKWATWCKQKHP